MKQINYVLAYTQAVVEKEMYMEAPKSFTFCDGSRTASSDNVLQIKCTPRSNYYRQKQDAQVWNQDLVSKLEEASFTQSKHEECLFYQEKTI